LNARHEVRAFLNRIWNIRRQVKLAADAVAAQTARQVEAALTLGVILNGLSPVTE
jgi:hypothetical protein